jgi:uncharacterized protein YbjT (DUF2867 family)
MPAAAKLSVVMLGASGAVAGCVVRALVQRSELQRLTLLNRRELPDPPAAARQHIVDVFDPATYSPLLAGHISAICTFGVGQPSKVPPAELVRVDHDAVLAFAKACRAAGIAHFELLGAVGAAASSRIHYLRTKGHLVDALNALGFTRLSVFQPSVIVTPANRYGLSQAATLAVMPLLSPLLIGGAKKFRSVAVDQLGRAMALNLLTDGEGSETLHWPDFQRLAPVA